MYPDVNETQCFVNTITISPVLSVHANYVANDYVGTSSVAAVIANAARVPGGRGEIRNITLIDYAAQSISGELWVYTAAVVPPLDSAAWTMADASQLSLVGVFPFSTYYSAVANTVSHYDGWPRAFKCANGSTSLYSCFVTRGAPAYASGDLNFVIQVLYD